MNDNLLPKNVTSDEANPSSQSGRKKQKIRIKYRERVRIKQRPKGNKVMRYLAKNKKIVLSYIILISLLSATLFMLGNLAVHRVEMNKLQKDLNTRIPK